VGGCGWPATTQARTTQSLSSRALTLKLKPPERLYQHHLLELLAVVHALKSLCLYLLDKPFKSMAD
jgi:hypothetical protein